MKEAYNFIGGKMNHDLDPRMIPQGDYMYAVNARITSPDNLSESGALRTAPGTSTLTSLEYNGTPIDSTKVKTRCIGAYKDESNNTVYWFVHCEELNTPFTEFPNGTLDLIMSYNEDNGTLTYHVVDDKGILNFSFDYTITGISLIDDLLYFTDNLNSPKKINVKFTYTDYFTDYRLDVIVSPPKSAPSIEFITTTSTSDYIEDRFLAFSYRYKYENGEYSALSQYSEIAFRPELFFLDPSTLLNDGMKNKFLAVRISFNTGGKWVTDIELCVKAADSNEVYVVQSWNKRRENWGDNILRFVDFTGDKSYSVLPSTEWVRLYDNVPRRALAQVIMGNRLMYGNYLENYNISTKFLYGGQANFIDVESKSILGTLSSYIYKNNWYQTVTSQTVSSAQFSFNMAQYATGVPIGTEISFAVPVASARVVGNPLTPPNYLFPVTWNRFFVFYFQAPRNYTSLLDLINDAAFKRKLGADANYYNYPITYNVLGIPNNCSFGGSITDEFICAIGGTRNGFTMAVVGGNSLIDNGFQVSLAGSVMNFILPAVGYSNGAGAYRHEYFYVTGAPTININIPATNKSLHSNRTYELGMVYMDEWGRSSTVQLSKNSTIEIPAFNSNTANYIKATIPRTQLPPPWAKKYKWVLKPTKMGYDTIYSSIYYKDGDRAWIKLDGESQNKVEVGDILYVKRDSAGATLRNVKVEVLDKEVKPDQWGGGRIPGVYMRVKLDGWTANFNQSNIRTVTGDVSEQNSSAWNGYGGVVLDLFDAGPPTVVRWPVNAGALVEIYIRVWRNGRNCGGSSRNCGQRSSLFHYKNYVSSANYDDFKQFWEGEGIDINLSTKDGGSCPDDAGQCVDAYNSSFLIANVPPAIDLTNQYQFSIQAAGQQLNNNAPLQFIIRSGTKSCAWPGPRTSNIEARIVIQNNPQFLVFETEPNDAAANLFYENEEVFDILNGYHQGNVQNQAGLTSAISNLGFYDCWTFGNGIESYKIKDSITGRSFGLGQKVHASSVVPYREERRLSDIIYSGVYNRETNLNKLNEFNIGLLNFKSLEASYASIQRMHQRETDILVFQEDRVSRVLVGKNIISDVVGGGALASVPEVLGNQIVISQENGISTHPQSFASYGDRIYFTDVKRSVVLQLIGDQLKNVSDAGMISFFKKTFDSIGSGPVRGGFDPYSREYVLSVPAFPTEIIEDLVCGFSKNITNTNSVTAYIINVDISSVPLGDVLISWSASTGEDGFGDIFYNGAFVYTITDFLVTGSFNLTKIFGVDTLTIYIYPNIPPDANYFSISLQVGCPVPSEIEVILVTVTSPEFTGQTIEHYYNGQSAIVTLGPNVTTTYPIVAQWTSLGLVAQGGWLPANGGAIKMHTVKGPLSTYNPNISLDKFRRLRTNTTYPATSIGAANLLAASTILPSLTVDTDYAPYPGWASTFNLPTTGSKLYLIWDYRRATLADACYNAEGSPETVCCSCASSCPSCTMWQSSGIFLSSVQACAAPIVMTIYSSSTLSLGSKVYFDEECSFTAYPGFYQVAPPGKFIQVDGSGTIIQTLTSC
jgi:hypothetical protein